MLWNVIILLREPEKFYLNYQKMKYIVINDIQNNFFLNIFIMNDVFYYNKSTSKVYSTAALSNICYDCLKFVCYAILGNTFCAVWISI